MPARMLYQVLHRLGQKLVHRRKLWPPVAGDDPARSLSTLDLVILGVNHTVSLFPILALHISTPIHYW